MPQRCVASSTRTPVPQSCRCETLEPRRMLAVYNATEGADTIRIASSLNNLFYVTINQFEYATLDHDVTINCLGGNDTVLFGRIGPGTNTTHFPVINLGNGDDFVANDDASGPESLDQFTSGMAVFGGAGNDRLQLDDGGATASFRQFDFDL